MLVLARNTNQTIVIGRKGVRTVIDGAIVITNMGNRHGENVRCKIGVEAPVDVPICRGEILEESPMEAQPSADELMAQAGL